MSTEPTGNGSNYSPLLCLSDLMLDELNRRKYAIYIVDYEWNYVFVNDYVNSFLGNVRIVGKNVKDVWKEMPAINFETIYNALNDGVKNRTETTIRTTSPLSGKWVEIKGMPLSDCYYFSVIPLPEKESLLSELKVYLKRS